jgi:hypothetical protein
VHGSELDMAAPGTRCEAAEQHRERRVVQLLIRGPVGSSDHGIACVFARRFRPSARSNQRRWKMYSPSNVTGYSQQCPPWDHATGRRISRGLHTVPRLVAQLVLDRPEILLHTNGSGARFRQVRFCRKSLQILLSVSVSKSYGVDLVGLAPKLLGTQLCEAPGGQSQAPRRGVTCLSLPVPGSGGSSPAGAERDELAQPERNWHECVV